MSGKWNNRSNNCQNCVKTQAVINQIPNTLSLIGRFCADFVFPCVLYFTSLVYFYLWCPLNVMQIWRNYKLDSMEWWGAETISRHPEEMHFTVICGGNAAALGQTSDADPFFSLSSLFTQGDTDVRGQSDQADALILTWGKSYSYSCGWTDAILRELTGGGRIWVSLSAAEERGSQV